MSHQFRLAEICDQNVNILLGAGASSGLFPTLALGIKQDDGSPTTVESLATSFGGDKRDSRYTALFMHYYKHCIEPVFTFDFSAAAIDPKKKIVIENYARFLETTLKMLRRKKSGDRKVCNIFTTNYDGCLTNAAEDLLMGASQEFFLNDGAAGFKRRYLDPRNFGTVLVQTGVLGRHKNEIPQINVINLHGSCSWYADKYRIRVDYHSGNEARQFKGAGIGKIKEFSEYLLNDAKFVKDLPNVTFKAQEKADFWTCYDALPIVNPTKWKFHETVFEEHYYQMLRYLSYELEKPNSVLLTFGFSFADEHIRQLVKRSVSNPSLQVFAFCFNEVTQNFVDTHFKQFSNFQSITRDGPLDFTAFNDNFFTVTSNGTVAAEEGVAE